MKISKNIVWVATLLLNSILIFVLTECLVHNPFTDLKVFGWILGIVIYLLINLLLCTLSGRPRLPIRIGILLSMLMGLANYYVISFRSSPILPWDIFSMRTAASVADNFEYTLPVKPLLVLAGFFVLVVAQQVMPYDKKRRRRLDFKSEINRRGYVKWVCVFLYLFFILGIIILVQNKAITKRAGLCTDISRPDIMQKENGILLSFLMELRYLKTEVPEGYDEEAAGVLLTKYEGEKRENIINYARQPNIIVIMDESFCDMSVIGDFTTNEDYIPFFRQMKGRENTVTGWLDVSVLGGNTANTEFEFLTGNTMAFLPYGSIPYQQYIKGRVPSLVWTLRENGYATVSIHPYRAKGWSRDKVYPWLGFEETRFIDDFEEPVYVRKYVSDKSDFDRVIQEYEDRDKGKPLFLFNVTMQNHGGYGQDFDNFTPEIQAEGIENKALSRYLSLLSLTDEALEELVSYFEKEEDDTILVFFGDHQPNDTISQPILAANGIDSASLTRKQKIHRYQAPFFIWANFDINEDDGLEMSCNYFGLEVLRQAGIPNSSYDNYREEMQKKFPVISAYYVIDKKGNILNQDEINNSSDLQSYRKLQYYQLSEHKDTEKP